MAQHSLALPDMMQHYLAQDGMAQSSTVQHEQTHGMAQPDIVCHSMTWHGSAQFSMTQFSMVSMVQLSLAQSVTTQPAMAQCDMAWHNLAQTLCPPPYARGDLCLHEDEDEDEDSREPAGHHHPDREGTLLTQGVDDPAPLLRGCHREPAGHTQLLQDRDRNAGGDTSSAPPWGKMGARTHHCWAQRQSGVKDQELEVANVVEPIAGIDGATAAGGCRVGGGPGSSKGGWVIPTCV